jgi:hypothetical protein
VYSRCAVVVANAFARWEACYCGLQLSLLRIGVESWLDSGKTTILLYYTQTEQTVQTETHSTG